MSRSAALDNQDTSLDGARWSLTIVTVVFSIEFLLPSALSSYGVFFNEFVEDDCFRFHSALWTPVVFVASWNLMNPWSRRIGQNFEERKEILKVIAIIGAITLSLGVGVSALVKNIVVQVLFYGAVGGAGISIVLMQIKIFAWNNFRSKPEVFESILQIAKVISIFIFPHCVLFLSEHYGVFKAQGIFAAVLLHALPITLLLPNNGKRMKPPKLLRYRTIPGLEDSIELPTINKDFTDIFKPIHTSNMKSIHVDDDSDSSSSDSSDSYTFEEVREDMARSPVPFRLKNNMGVEILPEIPEEDESYEDNSRKISMDIKRLSKISDRFEEKIGKALKNDGSNMFSSVGELENGLHHHGPRKKRKFFREFQRNSGGCCSPYRKFIFRKRCRTIGHVLFDNFIKPLNIALKCFYFYPSLWGKTCMALTYVVYISVIPHVALVNGANYSVDITEAVFLLTFISVAWCFFLISLPWVINMSKLKIRVLHILGMLLTSGSYFMVHLSVSHDMITVSCLVFGLGYGTTSFVEEIVYRNTLGQQKWELVVGTLETFTGILVILIYFIIFMLKLMVHDIFLVFFVLVSINVVLWIVAPIINFAWLYIKKKRRNYTFP